MPASAQLNPGSEPGQAPERGIWARAHEVFVVFLGLGLTSFGGPVAHIGYFHKALVEQRKWLRTEQFGQLFALCQFLPGPASSQLGFGLGLMRAGWLGALAAFVGFTLPSALLLFAFALSLPQLPEGMRAALTEGLKLVAFAVVADALYRMSRRLLTSRQSVLVAAICALLLLVASAYQLSWAALCVVAAAALYGMLYMRASALPSAVDLPSAVSARMGWGMLALYTTFGLVAVLSGQFEAGQQGVLGLSRVFYHAGALVFGGGHVVLPLLEQGLVGGGYVSGEDFLAGYGAAQAVPGPLFSVAAFYGAHASLELSSALGALSALCALFLPGFLLLLAVLPWWQFCAKRQYARRALAGVNAAVVGLLFSAWIDPILLASIKGPSDAALGLSALFMLLRWRLSALWVVLWCCGAKLLLWGLF